MAINNNNKETIVHIIIKGKPYERGLSYGKQMKEKIIENLNYYKNRYVLLDWLEVHHFIRNNYMKAIEKHYPSGLEEMRGMAAGADLTIEDIIALNARYELMRWNRQLLKESKEKAEVIEEVPQLPHECTSAVCLSKATKWGDVLMGQNWDQNKRIIEQNMALLLEVHPDQSENMAPFIMLTEIGALGRSGMNANGLGITGMSLFSSEDHFGRDNRSGYLPISLFRRLFIESPTFTVALKRLISAPRHVSINMTVATAEDEAINIEMTPNNYFITYPSLETHFLTHCNLFKSDAYFGNNSVKDTYICGSSLVRDSQMQKALYTKCKYGTINLDSFTNAFTNHIGFPDSMCAHIPINGREDLSTTPNLCTVANIIMNLTTKTLKVCLGQPCVGVYTEYSFNNTKK